MAAKPVKIAFLADTAALQSGLGKAEAAMDAAAAQAQTAGGKIDSAFSSAAGAADATASASSQAAGGLGDLAGALSATGLVSEGTAASMETAAAAIMGVTGASDLLNLATEKIPGVQKAATVATNALATAKRALGVAIRFAMGPVGLLIAGAALLTAAIVLLWKRNETFREIVTAVWTRVKSAIGSVVSWFTDTAGPAIRNGVATVTQKFNDIRDKIGEVVGSYSAGGGGALGKLHSLVQTVGGLGAKIKTATVGMWDGIKDSFRGVINAIIGWWNNLSFSIDIPDKIPGLPDSFSISTPNIPMLAEGGLVTRPTLAVVGEAGPEVVIPLDRLNGLGGGTLNVRIDLGAEQLAQVERGRRIVADARAYIAAGGTPIS